MCVNLWGWIAPMSVEGNSKGKTLKSIKKKSVLTGLHHVGTVGSK